MLFLFETTLFVQKHPVLYHVYMDNATDRFFFHPHKYLAEVVYPPSFHTVRYDGTWQFDGITDYELKDQAIDDIHFYMDLEVVDSK